MVVFEFDEAKSRANREKHWIDFAQVQAIWNDPDLIEISVRLARPERPLQVQKKVNVDFPTWMIESVNKEASRLGVTRQSIIKIWLAERLEQSASYK